MFVQHFFHFYQYTFQKYIDAFKAFIESGQFQATFFNVYCLTMKFFHISFGSFINIFFYDDHFHHLINILFVKQHLFDCYLKHLPIPKVSIKIRQVYSGLVFDFCIRCFTFYVLCIVVFIIIITVIIIVIRTIFLITTNICKC